MSKSFPKAQCDETSINHGKQYKKGSKMQIFFVVCSILMYTLCVLGFVGR